MKPGLLLLALVFPLLARTATADTSDVNFAINALGLDLYHIRSAGDGNLLFSPLSIQNALAMTYAGADGDTRAEMQRVLHYPVDDTALHAGFAALARELLQAEKDSAQAVAIEVKTEGRNPATPVELHLANRLFVQSGFQLLSPFLKLVNDDYGAAPEPLDFAHAAEQARATINGWVEGETNGKIGSLIPPGADLTGVRLALANAIYFRAGWEKPFDASFTKPAKFFVRGTASAMVPTMNNAEHLYGYLHRDGFAAVGLPYAGGGFQFLILLPDARDGLPALERKVTPELLAQCANLAPSFVDLYLPKFMLTPPTVALGDQLQQLGLKTAFDKPPGSANFDRMAPRRPDDYLAIGEVFHKAFLSLDEDGTEAAAATVVEMMLAASAFDSNAPQPIEVRADHPFIFAIQHLPSGACLFLGRVTDPR